MAVDGWDVNISFTAWSEELEAKLDPALLKSMEYIRSVVTPLVPIETGDLVGSGDVGVGPAPGDQPQEHLVHLYFPGPYALYQHNGVFYRYGQFGAPLNHTHGESFFLIRPMIQEAGAALEIFKEEMGL